MLRHSRVGAARGAGMHAVLLALAMSFVSAAAATAPALAKVPASYLREDKTLAYDDARIEGAKLGVELPGGPEEFLDVKQSSSPHLVKGSALAYTSCYAADDDIVGCEINVGTAPHTAHELLAATIAHEVFHAFEVVMCGKVSTCKAMKFKWLVEGGAEWVGVQVAGEDASSRRVLGQYFSHPSLPLFQREYTALGFFDHMQSVGISPWSKFKAMFAQTNDESAYFAGIADNLEFLTTEASVFFREASGWPWAPRPQSAPSGRGRFRPRTIAVGGAGHPPVEVAAYADGVYHLVLSGMSKSKPVLELRVRDGYVRIRSSNGDDVDQVVTGTIKLCSLREGCNCPGHDEHAPVFLDGNLAITGATLGGDVELIARPRCEPILAARSCDGELPGYSSTVADMTEAQLSHFTAKNKFAITESRNASVGYVSFTCTFLFKESSSIIMKPIPLEPESGERGVEPPHLLPGEAPLEEEVFHGVIASGFNISRYGTKQAAIDGLQLQVRLGGSSTARVRGVGEEAFLGSTTELANSWGESEYSSAGFVRVRNLTAYFLIAGDSEADPTWALSLLRAVAREL
jgi:hypothetical protein